MLYLFQAFRIQRQTHTDMHAHTQYIIHMYTYITHVLAHTDTHICTLTQTDMQAGTHACTLTHTQGLFYVLHW